MSDLPPLLGLTDLVQRWGRSREYVRRHLRDADDFPAPAGAINGGRNRFWLEAELAAYEARNPSVRADHAGGSDRPTGARATPERPAPADQAGRSPRRTEQLPPSHFDLAGEHEREYSPEMRAAIERMRERERMKSEGRTPVAFVLAFTFDRKPPFEFRERLKRQGWTYLPKDREWTARVRPRDVQDWCNDFESAGARKVYGEPQFE